MAYKLNLTHRGPQVINGFDLFDECHYGADKLFLRGHLCCPETVREQVEIALGYGNLDTAKLEEYYGEGVVTDDFKKHKLGIGDPLTETPENGDLSDVPTIALNRYHIPNKKFWNNTPPMDIANPYKASAAVKFSLRVYFRDDFAYITFGCPWSAIMDEATEEKSSFIAEKVEDWTSRFALLECHFISKEDALQVLNAIFPNMGTNVALIDEVLELEDSDGNVLSL